MAPSRPKYPGALGRRCRPISEPGDWSLLKRFPNEQAEVCARNVFRQKRHKRHGVSLLLEHYGIPAAAPDESPGWVLAMKLAETHVPYFQPRERRRRPKAETYRFALLEIEMAAMRVAGIAASDAAALDHVCMTDASWREWFGNESFMRQVRRARIDDPLARIVRRMILSMDARGQLTEELLEAMRADLENDMRTDIDALYVSPDKSLER
jgi:hypothetical protein